LEGNVEPVYYMGVVVGYIRKFSDKLQIEMLRAYKPDRYKTPGTQVNIGTKGDIFVLTEEQRHVLMDYKRNELLAYQRDHLPAPEEPQKSPGTDMSLRTTDTYDEKKAIDAP
jgi:hypothetical protein